MKSQALSRQAGAGRMTVLFKAEDFTRKTHEVTALSRQAAAGRMTVLFKVEDFTRKIHEVTGIPPACRGRQDDDLVAV